jgi:hypothetical protein
MPANPPNTTQQILELELGLAPITVAGIRRRGPRSLAEAERETMEILRWQKNGGVCPCCKQRVKVYRRYISSAMAMGLYLMAHETKNGTAKDDVHKIQEANGKTTHWLHIENFLKQLPIPSSIRGDVAKLTKWGLLEPEGKPKDDNNPSNGYYRVTPTGFAYIQGLFNLPRYKWVYNDEVIPEKLLRRKLRELPEKEKLKMEAAIDELQSFQGTTQDKFQYDRAVKQGLYLTADIGKIKATNFPKPNQQD